MDNFPELYEMNQELHKKQFQREMDRLEEESKRIEDILSSQELEK